MSNTYNGWTNYATWRVNLEIFDGTDLEDMSWDDCLDAYQLSHRVEEYAKEVVSIDCESSSLALSYAFSFMSEVNWVEIASAMIETYKDEVNS